MKSNRGELVPIGDPVLDLPDLGNKTIRDAEPGAMRHFTRFDQMDQLVGVSEAEV